MDTNNFRELTFDEASPLFIEIKKPYVSARSLLDYKQYQKAMSPFFGGMRLCDINIGNIRGYQSWRKEKAGATRINHEMSFLVMMLKEADCWKTMGTQFKPLPTPRPSMKRLPTAEEEQRLFLIAQTRKRWIVAYCCALLTTNTGAGPGELRHLRVGDIHLKHRTMHIREGTKNAFRVREVPLNDAALFAAEALIERYKKLVKRNGLMEDPNHFLLPHCANTRNGPTDFARPMYGWRRAWDNLRTAAGLPWLKKYTLRSFFATRLLEQPNVSEETVIALMGHCDREMLKRYSHLRREKKMEAVNAIATVVPRI